MFNKKKKKINVFKKIIPGFIYTIGLGLVYFLVNNKVNLDSCFLSYCHFFYLTTLIGGVFFIFLKKTNYLSKIIIAISIIWFFELSLFS